MDQWKKVRPRYYLVTLAFVFRAQLPPAEHLAYILTRLVCSWGCLVLTGYPPAFPIIQAGLSPTIFMQEKQDHESALYKFSFLIQRETAPIFH